MKNNKGITMTSLIIYVLGMTILLGTIANLTSFFYKNIDVENEDTTTQYTKFSSIFLNEINLESNYVVDCKTSNEDDVKISYIVFSSGNQYTFTSENNSIYQNNVKICSNIDDCDFSYNFSDSKYKIKVNFKTKTIDLTGENAITYSI